MLGMARGDTMDNMEFLGMVGLHDPPRPRVSQAVDIFHSTGVKVITNVKNHKTISKNLLSLPNVHNESF